VRGEIDPQASMFSYVDLHDRDSKYCQSFRDIIESGDMKPLRLTARSPNLNAFSECCVKSIKVECLSKLIPFGEASLRRALREYLEHYYREGNHKGKDNIETNRQ